VTENRHLLQELGFVLQRSADELHGSAEVIPAMFVPGTASVRTSILATWTDVVAGLLAADVIGPRVPVTLELDVHLYEQPTGIGAIHAVGRTVKAGRSVVVASVDFTTEDGRPLAVGSGSFLAAPDQALTLPDDAAVALYSPPPRLLDEPLAAAAGCRRTEPGVAVLPRSEGLLNASNTINGGLLTMVAEEAVLSLAPGTLLSSMGVRFVRPLRQGPAVATARAHAGLGQVEVRDAGAGDRLSALATTRAFPA
jgi:acyl-coenzyme A thioesterase PaaI-like protein